MLYLKSGPPDFPTTATPLPLLLIVFWLFWHFGFGELSFIDFNDFEDFCFFKRIESRIGSDYFTSFSCYPDFSSDMQLLLISFVLVSGLVMAYFFVDFLVDFLGDELGDELGDSFGGSYSEPPSSSISIRLPDFFSF